RKSGRSHVLLRCETHPPAARHPRTWRGAWPHAASGAGVPLRSSSTETCGRANAQMHDGHSATPDISPRRPTMKRNTTWFGLTLAVLLLPALAAAPARAQQTDLNGAWLGTLQAGPMQLRLVFHLTRQADGTYRGALDSPDQGAQGIPASAV